MEQLELRKHQFARFAYNSDLRYGTERYRLAESAYFAGVLAEHYAHTGNMLPMVTFTIMSGRQFLTRQEYETLSVKELSNV